MIIIKKWDQSKTITENAKKLNICYSYARALIRIHKVSYKQEEGKWEPDRGVPIGTNNRCFSWDEAEVLI